MTNTTPKLVVETAGGALETESGFVSSVKGMGRRAGSVFGFGAGDAGGLGAEEPHSASRIDALRRSGSFQGKAPFDAFDDLESGHAREVVTEECLSPAEHDTNWTHCYLVRVDKVNYKMYSQKSHRFLLSAKKVGDHFYISQYESFPDETAKGVVPSARYCAVMRGGGGEEGGGSKVDRKRFRLWLCGCEDPETHYSLERFAAGSTAEERIDGQLLADVTHYSKVVEGAEAEMRAMSLSLPAVLPDRRNRVLWCPRAEPTMPMSGVPTPRLSRSSSLPPSWQVAAGGGGGGGSPNQGGSSSGDESDGGLRAAAVTAAAAPSSAAGVAARGGGAAGAPGAAAAAAAAGAAAEPGSSELGPILLESRLPEWNESVGSLVLKFTGGRVQCASAKNFLLAEKARPENAVLQFGKAHKGRFALDFRYPLAPLQALGICLSACNWTSS
jgi:hypothetical protein